MNRSSSSWAPKIGEFKACKLCSNKFVRTSIRRIDYIIELSENYTSVLIDAGRLNLTPINDSPSQQVMNSSELLSPGGKVITRKS